MKKKLIISLSIFCLLYIGAIFYNWHNYDGLKLFRSTDASDVLYFQNEFLLRYFKSNSTEKSIKYSFRIQSLSSISISEVFIPNDNLSNDIIFNHLVAVKVKRNWFGRPTALCFNLDNCEDYYYTESGVICTICCE
jgi:hypothetical protein